MVTGARGYLLTAKTPSSRQINGNRAISLFEYDSFSAVGDQSTFVKLPNLPVNIATLPIPPVVSKDKVVQSLPRFTIDCVGRTLVTLCVLKKRVARVRVFRACMVPLRAATTSPPDAESTAAKVCGSPSRGTILSLAQSAILSWSMMVRGAQNSSRHIVVRSARNLRTRFNSSYQHWELHP